MGYNASNSGLKVLLSNLKEATETLSVKGKYHFDRVYSRDKPNSGPPHASNTISILRIPREEFELIISNHIPTLHNLIVCCKDELEPEKLSKSNAIDQSSRTIQIPIRVSQIMIQIKNRLESFLLPIESGTFDEEAYFTRMTSTRIDRASSHLQSCIELYLIFLDKVRSYLRKICKEASIDQLQPFWNLISSVSDKFLMRLERFKAELTPQHHQCSMEIFMATRGEVIQNLIINFNEAASIMRDGMTKKYCIADDTLVLEVPQGDYDQISSEHLPNLREKVISLNNSLDPKNFLDRTNENSIFSPSLGLPVDTSKILIKMLSESMKPSLEHKNSEERVVGERISSFRTQTDSIFIPVGKYFSIVSKIEDISKSWIYLMEQLRRYFETLKGREDPKRLPSQFPSQTLRRLEIFLKSIDNATHEISKSNEIHFLEMFRSSENVFENSILRCKIVMANLFKSFSDGNSDEDGEEHEDRGDEGEENMQIDGDDEGEDEGHREENGSGFEEKQLFPETWLQVLILFRLLMRKLSRPSRHLLSITSRFSYITLHILNDEFRGWRSFWIGYEDRLWSIGKDTLKSSEKIFQSLERIRDVLLLERFIPLKRKNEKVQHNGSNQRNESFEFDISLSESIQAFDETLERRTKEEIGFDRMIDRFGTICDGIKIDENDDEKVWLKTWLSQVCLSIQNSLLRLSNCPREKKTKL